MLYKLPIIFFLIAGAGCFAENFSKQAVYETVSNVLPDFQKGFFLAGPDLYGFSAASNTNDSYFIVNGTWHPDAGITEVRQNRYGSSWILLRQNDSGYGILSDKTSRGPFPFEPHILASEEKFIFCASYTNFWKINIDGNEYGPFTELTWSLTPGLHIQTRKQNGFYYACVGTRLFGPYSETARIFFSGRNYMVSGRLNSQHYLAVNGQEFGPYRELFIDEHPFYSDNWACLIKTQDNEALQIIYNSSLLPCPFPAHRVIPGPAGTFLLLWKENEKYYAADQKQLWGIFDDIRLNKNFSGFDGLGAKKSGNWYIIRGPQDQAGPFEDIIPAITDYEGNFSVCLKSNGQWYYQAQNIFGPFDSVADKSRPGFFQVELIKNKQKYLACGNHINGPVQGEILYQNRYMRSTGFVPAGFNNFTAAVNEKKNYYLIHNGRKYDAAGKILWFFPADQTWIYAEQVPVERGVVAKAQVMLVPLEGKKIGPFDFNNKLVAWLQESQIAGSLHYTSGKFNSWSAGTLQESYGPFRNSIDIKLHDSRLAVFPVKHDDNEYMMINGREFGPCTAVSPPFIISEPSGFFWLSLENGSVYKNIFLCNN